MRQDDALRVLAGLESTDAGTIAINGADISMVATSKRDMGMVFSRIRSFRT